MCMLIYVAARPWRLTVCRTVRQRLFVFFIPPLLCSALLRSSEDSWSTLKAAESNSSNQSKRYQGMMFFFARGAQRSTDLFRTRQSSSDRTLNETDGTQKTKVERRGATWSPCRRAGPRPKHKPNPGYETMQELKKKNEI